jgi:hypothetical protein
MNSALLFLPGAALAFRLVFLGYQISAGVGVWRSADAFLARRGGGRAFITFADSTKAVGAKAVVLLLVVIHGILLLRILSILASHSQ